MTLKKIFTVHASDYSRDQQGSMLTRPYLSLPNTGKLKTHSCTFQSILNSDFTR
jgi:hypothetical protein